MSVQLYYPIGPDPFWFKRTKHEGHDVFQVEAGGGPRCIAYRYPMQQSKAINIEATPLFKNQLQASDNGYEGVTAQIRAIKMDGLTQNIVFNNNVLVSGNKNKWQWESDDGWRSFPVIEQLPLDLECDFVDIMFIVKAPSGLVHFRNFSAHNRYDRRYLFERPAALGTSQLQDNLYGEYIGKRSPRYTGIQNFRRIWYMESKPVDIRKDDLVKVEIEAIAEGNVNHSEGGYFTFTIGLRDRNSNYIIPGGIGAQMRARNDLALPKQIVKNSGGFIAWKDFVQVDFIVTVAAADYSALSMSVEHHGADCDIVVSKAISND